MRKNIGTNLVVFFFLIVLIMGLSGCSRTNARDEEGFVNFRSGSRGLDMRFVDGQPAYEVYEGDKLYVGLEMFNRGAAPINNGKIFITGYDPRIIKTFNNWETGDLPAYGTGATFSITDYKTQFNNEGGYEMLMYNSAPIDLDEGISTYNVPLVAYACYQYETIASDAVCIDPQPHRTNIDKPCITRDVTLGGGQGAPVAVTYVDVVNMGETVRMTFTISNIGEGTIVDYSSTITSCPTSFTPAEIDYVNYDFPTLGGENMIKCDPAGKIKLQNGYGKLTCTASVTGTTTAYESLFNIRLYYGYRTFIRKDVQIRSYD